MNERGTAGELIGLRGGARCDGEVRAKEQCRVPRRVGSTQWRRAVPLRPSADQKREGGDAAACAQRNTRAP